MHDVNRTRTKTRRRALSFMLVALLSAFFVLLGACGSDDDSRDAMGATTADFGEPEPADMAEGDSDDAARSDGVAMEEAPRG